MCFNFMGLVHFPAPVPLPNSSQVYKPFVLLYPLSFVSVIIDENQSCHDGKSCHIESIVYMAWTVIFIAPPEKVSDLNLTEILNKFHKKLGISSSKNCSSHIFQQQTN